MNIRKNSSKKEPTLKDIHRLLTEIAEDVDLIKHAALMQFASMIDLSDRPGFQKLKQNKKVLSAVLKLHQKFWKKRVKLLERFH